MTVYFQIYIFSYFLFITKQITLPHVKNNDVFEQCELLMIKADISSFGVLA